MGGDKGGRVAPLSTFPTLEDTDLQEASVPSLFATCLVAHRSLSLSLSSGTCVSSLEACLTFHQAASKGESASRGSTQQPLRPCARL
jgi:hypothetical protein